MEVETATQKPETPSSQTPFKNSSPAAKTLSAVNEPTQNGLLKSLSFSGRSSEIQAQLDRICDDDSADEISEWEFDAIHEKIDQTTRR